MERKLKEMVFAFLLILLISVVVFSLIYFFGTPPLNLSVKVEKDTFEKGEPVKIDAVLKNVGLWSVTIENAYFHISVEDEHGHYVWYVFLSRFYPPINRTTLDRGEEIKQSYEWPQIGEEFLGGPHEVLPGTYQFEASVHFKYMGNRYDWETSPTRIVIV